MRACCTLLIVGLARADNMASIRMNGAQLQASCVDSPAAVTDYGLSAPLSGLVIDGFSRSSEPAHITARFARVPPSCAGVSVSSPCVAPEGDLRPPLFFCAMAGHYGTIVNGPYRANATNVYIGSRWYAHQAELVCPLPTFGELLALTGYEGDGFGHNITLSVRHYAADRVIPYEVCLQRAGAGCSPPVTAMPPAVTPLPATPPHNCECRDWCAGSLQPALIPTRRHLCLPGHTRSGRGPIRQSAVSPAANSAAAAAAFAHKSVWSRVAGGVLCGRG